MAVVTLLTDFGILDTYVGQMKGAILAVAPSVTIVDLTHLVSPQDVGGGAFLLWAAVTVFPRGTVHLAVVDPGVGSARRPVAVRVERGDTLVGPDNGLLMPAVERLGGARAAVELTETRYWRPDVAATFHGRHIFAPVAGHLALGVPVEQLGRPISDLDNSARWPAPAGLDGEVIHVDTYGNLVTNLPASRLPPRFTARVNGHAAPAATHYAAVAEGALMAIIGSAGLLEISARNGSAAAVTRATRGTPVRVEAD